MRRINSAATNTKEAEEPALRRTRSSQSPTLETGGLGRTVPHAPVTSQSWSRSYSQQTAVGALLIYKGHSTTELTETLLVKQIHLKGSI